MEIVQTFREKGAVSAEKALTIQELGLPPRFKQAMHRRLGQTKIFVELNGKYYLDEERLKQIQEQRNRAGYSSGLSGRTRYAGVLLMLPIGLIVAVVIFLLLIFSGANLFPGEFLVILAIVMIVVALFRILFWRSRKSYWHTGIDACAFVLFQVSLCNHSSNERSFKVSL